MKGTFKVDCDADYIVVETYRIKGTVDNTSRIWGPYTDIQSGEKRIVGYENGNGARITDTNDEGLALVDGGGCVTNWVRYFRGVIVTKYEETDSAGSEKIPLEGAVFKVEYYAVADASKQDTEDFPVVAAWYFKTDEDGEITYGSKDYLSTWTDPDTGVEYTSDALFRYSLSNTSQSTYRLPEGSLKITEVEAPDKYELDSTPYTVSITGPNDKDGNISIETAELVLRDGTKATDEILENGVIVYDPPANGYLNLRKVSGNTSVTNGNTGYSLSGAQYTVYTDQRCSTVAKDAETDTNAVLTVTADGTSNTLCLETGTYYVKETKAPAGYLKDTSVRTVEITSDDTEDDPAVLSVTETPVTYSPTVLLVKENEAGTSHDLSGAIFKLEFYAGQTSAAGTVTRTWYFETDADGQIIFNLDYKSTTMTSDPFYHNSDDNLCLPIGFLKITEEQAPSGFVVSDKVVTYTTTSTGISFYSEDGTETYYNAPIVSDTPVYGAISIDKKDWCLDTAEGDASLAGFTFAIISLNNDTVTVKGKESVKYSYGDTVMTITTDASGHAETESVIQAGKYKIVEVGQGTGYTASGTGTEQEFTISVDGEVIKCTVTNVPIAGGLSVQKVDYMLGRSADHGDTGLGGAEFTIVNASANAVLNAAGNTIQSSGLSGTSVTYADVQAAIEGGYTMQVITTSADGSASTGATDLPYGTYYVIETKAATGYLLNEAWVGRIEVRENGVVYAAQTIQDSNSGQETTAQQIYRSGISLTKDDLEMRDDVEQGMATFEGAKFAIINASDALVKNADGKEIPSAKGLLSSTPTYAELRSVADDGSYTVQVMTTDENGQWSTGSQDLPYGTYYVIEIESSYGYWIDEGFVGKVVIREDNVQLALGETSASGMSSFVDINDTASDLSDTVDQQIRRSDLNFLKVDIDGNYKSYIPFLITAIAIDDAGNEVELESHVIVSDAYGLVDTSRTHSTNTNGFDQYVVDGKVTAEGETLLKEASTWGVWFQGNGEMDTDDMTVTNSYGALYPCYYKVTELQCENNSGSSENLLESDMVYIYNNVEDLTELLSNSSNNNAMEYTYHPLVDTEIVLTSSAMDVATSTQTVSVSSTNEVEDVVSYTHVSADHTYRMETKFVDITDGNKVLAIAGTEDADAIISDDGLWVTKEFQPEKKSTTNNTYGDITMQATLDTTGLNGHTIVAVDYLYMSINGYWVLVATHEDLTDTNQMLYVPDIHTNAVDGLTDSRVGTVSDGDYIVDTVTYTNLASRTNYVLVMYVADAETGEAVVKNADGTPYTVTRRIMSNTSSATISGTRVMPEYAIDASGFDGKTLVVVEALYLADEDDNPYGEPVIEYTSTVDEDESIRYPEVHTTASDGDTGDDVGTSSEAATVYDEVVIENVVFDDNDLDGQYTYTVTGKLVYQQDFTDADGVSHKAGDEVETLNGTLDTVTFTSDAAGNATFTYADGTTAKGTVTITGYGQNVSKTVSGGISNDYVTDTTAAIATVTVQLIYKVDSSKLEGGTTVVFEDLYHNNVNVASHADIMDESQTIHYPEVQTSASMDSTGDDVGEVAKDVSITDTVILTNLVPGRTYTVSGKLVDQETGKAVTVNGKAVTQTATITAGDGTITASNGEKTTVTDYDAAYNYVNGTVDLVFTFDASAMAGKTVVVFEDLIHNGVTVACHADLEDEGQTIHFPEIHTTAADGYTEDAVGTVSGEAVVVDTVIYTNLVPGRTYTVSGILMNKDTGEELIDANGKTVTAERTFTAGETGDGITATVDDETNSVSGTIDITFTFDGSLLEGTTVVAFEDLEHNGITVTTHSDLDDEDETVHFPKVRTSAIDGNVGDEVGMVDETVIVDTVSLWNLVPGMTYTVSGILMDKETGKELIDATGSTVTQTATITVNNDGTVTAANGETVTVVEYNEDMNSVDCKVDITFTLDASNLAGVTTVVFEDLIHNDITVASHTDITDLGQSVHFPEIHTTATDLDTSDHVGTVEEEAVIEDVVYYTNLVVGKEYTLTGTLMNRETGTPLLDESGNTITASATFTAAVESDDENNTVTAYHEDNNSVDGTYLITFTLDSSLLAGKTVVAFEDLYHNGVKVTTHADISDNDQSIYYPDIHTTALDNNTGDHVGTIWGALINFVRTALGQEAESDAKQVITDTVALENLVPGMTYVVSGKLYNVTESLETGVETPLVIDGEEITQCVTITVSEDGSSITAADGSKTSVTGYDAELNSVDGTVDLMYTLDSSKIQGIKLVVFETLYQDVTYTPETSPEEVPEEDKVNEHSDLEDEGQSVSEVSIHTTAVDTATGDHVGSVPDGTSVSVIHDTVNLAGLVEGMEYTVDGVLVSLGDSDFSAGTIYYLKADGTLTTERAEAYTESYTFTAEEASETHYLNFSVTSDKVQGKSLTVFENISHNGVVISSHPAGDGDGWDEEAFSEQTVYYPAGKTNATDTATGEHMSLADENRTIVDRVYFENLIAGQEYTISGQLVYKEAFTDADGVSHAAGEAVTEKIPVTFTAAADITAAYYADGTTAVVDSVTAKTLADGTVVVSGYVSISFTVNASKMAGATLVAFESFSHNGADIFTHNDLNDLPETIKIPKIGTTASVLDLDEAAIVDGNGEYIDITITDTVKYENLWTAAELASMKEQAKYIEYLDGTYRTQDSAIYTVSEDAVYMLKGVLMDKSTGKELTNSRGETYVVYSEAFTPESEDGSYDVKFVINAGDFLDEDGESLLAGATLVVYEDLYLASTKDEATEENHVAEHHDIDDVGQDIRIPDGKTHATDGASDVTITEDVLNTMDSQHAADSSTDHEADATESMTITDLVGYENLHGGTTYTATGTLQVVTETDENGTPTAWEAAVDDNGNAITATVEFTTSGSYEDSVSGTVTLTFAFSGVSLAGKTLVAFETVSREGVAVFVHADITNEAQTIYVPEIGTQAADALSGLDETVANSTTWILDTVSYENLEKGKEYTLSGILYDDIEGTTLGDTQVTGTFIAGEEDQIITSDGTVIMTKDELVEFLGGAASATTWKETASSEPVASTDITYSSDKVSELTGNSTGQGNRVSGEVYLLIQVDTSELGGHTVVVFEDLYAADSTGVLKQIASHEDAEDEAQSVNIPLVQTSATIADGEKSVVSGGVETVVDVVSYYNLTPGREYKVRGLLMDKTTGESTEVTVETTFIPDEADGSITLEFEVDTADFAGHELVVFEELLTKDEDGNAFIVGEHKDLDDASQTVLITAPVVAAVQTGDDINLIPALIILLIVVLLIVLGILLSRKKKGGSAPAGDEPEAVEAESEAEEAAEDEAAEAAEPEKPEE